MNKNLLIILYPVFILFLLCASPCPAQEKDMSLIAESEYFSIYGPAGLIIEDLLFKLNFDYFLHADPFPGEPTTDPKEILVKTIDAIYLEVSDILEIHIYSFHGSIKICPDQASLSQVFRFYFQEDFAERSFYSHEHKTIYVSSADLTLGMLGHEVAHALQSHYFVVPPPPKVQEILSGYVEYSLRKFTKTPP
jgi:hypothetical protein